ncbi:MAG: 50S ribosomal protein L24 [Candidatus Omnitrophica bacterium]|nr:50S ribosomal protein L24 [Candidatus Omnitrophota bacterium]
MKIKKNDNIKVLSGRDKGKTGKVLKIFPGKHKAIVEGVNFLKRHAKKTQNNPKGGIVQKESPINISSLAVICTRCNKPTRIGVSILSDGSKARHCRKCKETI